MTSGVLDGLSVLDLSEYVSGAYCGKLLADCGAEVIKVEKPGGDSARSVGPFLRKLPHVETSALFSYVNSNKLGITLDFTSRRGQTILKELVQKADVLVESFGPRFEEKIGLPQTVLGEWNPRLITVSISYFGERGPYVRFKGTPIIAHALGGYMYLNGDPDREPLVSSGPSPEYMAGLHGAVAALTGLQGRETSGKGLRAEVSIFEIMITLHQHTFLNYNVSRRINKRAGNHYPGSYPINLWPCRDGYVAISASNNDMVERMFIMMGMPEMAEDPRFLTREDRLNHSEDFDKLAEPWLMSHGKEEILSLCQEWRIPIAPVTTVSEVMADPQNLARGYWVPVEHPVAGILPYPGAPFRLSETPWRAGRAPLLGEHNYQVYVEKLGYRGEDLVRLRQAGVV